MRSMQRTCSLLLPLVITACHGPDSGGTVVVPDKDAPLDTAQSRTGDTPPDGGEQPGPIGCGDHAACKITFGNTASGTPTKVANFCTREKWPTHASAGLWPACVVDPDGTVYLMYLGGSQLIEMAGWTHGGYGGPTIESTLTPANLDRCRTAESMVALISPSDPVCPASSP
jgi:hypothetical protein